MAHTISVKPDENVLIWGIFIDGRPVLDWNRDLEANLNLSSGKHRLVYHVDGAGSTTEIMIDSNPKITTPRNLKWPVTIKLSDSTPTDVDAIHFVVP